MYQAICIGIHFLVKKKWILCSCSGFVFTISFFRSLRFLLVVCICFYYAFHCRFNPVYSWCSFSADVHSLFAVAMLRCFQDNLLVRFLLECLKSWFTWFVPVNIFEIFFGCPSAFWWNLQFYQLLMYCNGAFV